MNNLELILNEKHRGDCYKFLAACFYPPDKELFLQENLTGNLVGVMHQACPAAEVFAVQMEEAFRRYGHEELSVEYARLFLGPYELQAPPYGSIYLDGNRKVMDDSTIAVLAFYEEAGLSLSKDFHELPDHIAAELEFLYFLTYREIEALQNHDLEKAGDFLEFQERFGDRFLRHWVPPFCDRIRDRSENRFYRSLADCLSSFLENSHAPAPLRELLGRSHGE